MTAIERRYLVAALQGDSALEDTSPRNGPVWLTQQQAAEFLGISRWTLVRLAENEPLLRPVTLTLGLGKYPVSHLRRYVQQKIAASSGSDLIPGTIQ